MAQGVVTHSAGEGQAFWMLGGLYEVLLSSAETNGAATVMQVTLPPGMGPPPHVHGGVTETVYVVEGTLTYRIDGKAVEGGPGSIFHIPANTLESFEPRTRVRVVITYEPGGIEKFFAEAGERAQRREIPPAPTSAPDVARLSKIAAKYRLEISAPRA
ncbi:MAG TPA: cupin domain-containing protein [Anaeromyxobacteraceae bacterium]|nr:cupin domain-containing protein [Anaeromyxobacteraceae bacterium]